MATGRGRLLLPHWLDLQALRQPLGGVGAAPASGGFRKGPGAKFAAGCATLKQYARHEGHGEKPSVSLDSLPAEVLLQILSCLDAETLLRAGCVNRRFYHLANDKPNWEVSSVEKTTVSVLSGGDEEPGFWKEACIAKEVASVRAALAQVLTPVSAYTGLPVRPREALRTSGLGWAIILKEKSGKEYVMRQVEVSVNDSSVTIVWYSKNWPRLATLSTLDLCGVTPVFKGRSKLPTKNGPRWRSLIAQYSLSCLPESAAMGSDSLVRIFCLDPGLLVGLWKREEELAFIMANLHIHHLVERSTLGSAAVPHELPPHTPLLDDSTDYGLHGYQLHVDLHSEGVFCLCSTFRSLFTTKGLIENGYAKLTVISFKNNTEHLPLVGELGLSWRTDVFDGCIKSCSVMDVTLLDEYGKPFWCFSSPVCMRASPRPPDGSHFLGQTYCVDYTDSSGKVHMELLWIEETEEYFIVSLVLYLSVAKINHWFGTQH